MNQSKNKIVIGITLIACSIFLANEWMKPSSTTTRSFEPNSEISEEPVLASVFSYPFGIESLDSLVMISNKIKRNETLSSIFVTHGVPLQLVHDVVKSTKSVFDVRSLNLRKPYHFFFSSDSAKQPKYFIYEESLRDFVKIEFGDKIQIERGSKKSTYVEETYAGEIETSLYASLTEQKIEASLAGHLADVFAWQVDFYRLQKGDTYQLIIDRELIDNQPSGEFVIKAAKFNQGKETFYAFRFMENGVERYYDEEGNSLQKTFLKAPLKFSRVSSRYTNKRFHPVLKKYRAHLGTDYVAPQGTPVYAVADGIIEAAGFGSNNGNYVRIRHNSVYETGYLHFSRIAPGLKKGKKVRQGQVIGYVGRTGLASGVHLCYRFWKNGQQVDPYKQKNPPAKPMDEAFAKEFKAKMKSFKSRLDKLGQERSQHNVLAAL